MKTKIFIIVFSYILIALIIKHYSKHNLKTPFNISFDTEWISSMFVSEKPIDDSCDVVEEKIKPTLNKKISKPTIQYKHKKYSHVEIGTINMCGDTSIGSVTSKATMVYLWVDESGEHHESITPPSAVEKTSQRGFKVVYLKDYFVLNLYGEQVPKGFKEELSIKLSLLFNIYEKILEPESLKKVDLKFYFYKNKSKFSQIKEKYLLSKSVQGFYSHNSNSSYLMYINYHESMKLALHEATHAINRSLIGVIPRWLNEGLAEYSKYINIVGKGGQIIPTGKLKKRNPFRYPLTTLSALMGSTDADWKSDKSASLYKTSWAFIHFMMEDKNRKEQLVSVIKNEQLKRCTTLENNMTIYLSSFQEQFNKWSKYAIKSHSI